MTSISILGVTGRMGKALVQALAERRDLKQGGALASAGSSSLGKDVGELVGGGNLGVAITADVREAIRVGDVAIDFTTHSAVAEHLDTCVKLKRPLVIGTTGLAPATREALVEAARKIAIVSAPNMSVGVNLMSQLAEIAARILGEDFDAEIIEMHHRHKIDAPSGTALRIGERVAKARGTTLEEAAVYDRHGNNTARRKGQIGFAVVRAGDIVGEHTLLLSSAGESLAITHRATDRLTFARGALRAARWLTTQSPGLYSMTDVINTPAGA